MIEVESYIIMDKILGFSKRIAKDIKDSYIFPSEQYRYDRYAEFLNLDNNKYVKIMKGVFNATTE
jgi:T4 gene 59 helicase, C terminal.